MDQAGFCPEPPSVAPAIVELRQEVLGLICQKTFRIKAQIVPDVISLLDGDLLSEPLCFLWMFLLCPLVPSYSLH